MIPVSRPWMGEEEAEAARRPLLSGWVMQGPEVAAFEKEFAAYTGARFACAVSSGTTALHLALLAAGVGSGHEVITVSHSFIATANTIRYCGAQPVFVDIEPGTFNMNPALIGRAITPRSRAIVCVHQIGMPCGLAAIVALAHAHGLPVIEDAACAVGSEILWEGGWEMIGKPRGDYAAFSFHPRKLLTTGDGGMLTTASEEWDRQVRLLRENGMSISNTARHTATKVVFESYPVVGYNFRMTDIQAAVGREQLKRLPALLERRRHLARRYRSLLSAIPGLRLPAEPSWARSNWQSYCVRLPDGVDQIGVMQALLDVQISARRGVMCAHREAAYPRGTWACGPGGTCDCAEDSCDRLHESELAQDRCLILPLYHQMTESDQDRVVQALGACLS
ncbi:MAG: DegT/DnrJ/EryC1/StrS family aminotransferase [Bryobacteraceae bacterium]